MFLSYDNDDRLRVHHQLPTRTLIAALTADRRIQRIPLAPGRHMSGWAHNVGILLPRSFNPRPVASYVLTSLGAANQPYAGPILITGYRHDERGRLLLDLTPTQQYGVEHLDRAARAALGNPIE